MIRLLLIDNYDSFVFNALHLFQTQPGVELTVARNDESWLGCFARNAFDGVIIGPGPGSPEDDAYFGFCKHIINEHGRNGLPIFGICLGFQGLFALFGGQLCPAKLPVHGKVSRLNLTSAGINSPLLAQIETDTNVMRYHSIMADLTKPVPDCFELLAFAEPLDLNAKPSPNGQELMAIAHKHLPLFGVQFHPESFATDCGVDLARNFVEICRGQSSVGSLCESNPS